MKQGSSLVLRWLGLGAFTTVALGSTPGQGTKILQVTQWDQKENRCGPTIMRCLHVSAWGGGTQVREPKWRTCHSGLEGEEADFWFHLKRSFRFLILDKPTAQSSEQVSTDGLILHLVSEN